MTNKRKDLLNSLFSGQHERAPSSGAPTARSPAPATTSPRPRSGALREMQTSLNEMANWRQEADELRAQLSAGDKVIELDPGRIDQSSVADRLHVDHDPDFEQLVESIRDQGQQVPILVRPHPESEDRFQVVYGRRRLRAAERLDRHVLAIIRHMSDEELVIAQGRENSDRSDLTFIERALFALRLEEAGFDRHTIGAALSTDKGDLSRYLSIAKTIPGELILRIGPARKVGRPRWAALAEELKGQGALSRAQARAASGDLDALDSDLRFAEIAAAAAQQPAAPDANRHRNWKTPEGMAGAQIKKASNRLIVQFDEKAVPEFGEYVADRLDELYSEFLRETEGGDETTDG
ncbi:plasmid partitioning protein RepB [Amorphus sp. 3PC139-8]|uniref:plasmid partitioning protein RepB n=1 Tax=Amorphus sp. 3PC139-8 TaxID=2735676 RepID=UPI00345C6B4B